MDFHNVKINFNNYFSKCSLPFALHQEECSTFRHLQMIFLQNCKILQGFYIFCWLYHQDSFLLYGPA